MRRVGTSRAYTTRQERLVNRGLGSAPKAGPRSSKWSEIRQLRFLTNCTLASLVTSTTNEKYSISSEFVEKRIFSPWQTQCRTCARHYWMVNNRTDFEAVEILGFWRPNQSYPAYLDSRS